MKTTKKNKKAIVGKICALLACFVLTVTIFLCTVSAYDVSIGNGHWSYIRSGAYITYSCTVYDYINESSQGSNSPINSIPINSYAYNSESKSSSFQPYPSNYYLNISETLEGFYAGCTNIYQISAELGVDDELGLRFTTAFSPFYLLWDRQIEISNPFHVAISNSFNPNIIVNHTITMIISAYGGTEITQLIFTDDADDFGQLDISYDDILSRIPEDWVKLVWNGNYDSDVYGLYIEKIIVETDVYSDADNLSIYDFNVYHSFNYGTNSQNETYIDGNERYVDLDEIEIPPHEAVVEVIDGYVYVDGVNTGIESSSLDDADWLNLTIDWLADCVTSIMAVEIFPHFALGTIVIIVLAFSVTMWWLKVFGGG